MYFYKGRGGVVVIYSYFVKMYFTLFCKNVFYIINRLYLDIALRPGYR